MLLAGACAQTTGTGVLGDGGAGGNRDGNPLYLGDGGYIDGFSCGNSSLDWQGCSCTTPGAMHPCYTGPAATENKGLCHDGMQTCSGVGEFYAWGPCTGDVTPTNEVCTDKLDHNCNGLIGCDDPMCVGITGCCTPGATRPCYDGLAGTSGVGQCKPGAQMCDQQGAWQAACTGEVTPGPEAGNCHDGIDNDCNGLTDCADPACATDPGCQPMVCTPGAMRPCYDGPAGTEGVGQCKDGTQSCNQNGQWTTTCLNEVLPGMEAGNCHDHIDNDCNGLVDCGDPACATDPLCLPGSCQPGTSQSCYDGPIGTAGIGPCKMGVQSCNTMGVWTMCLSEVTPTSEAGHCHDGVDNDCNGLTDCADPSCANDPGCLPMTCTPGTMQACYDGPNGTRNVGQCKDGIQTCNQMGNWSNCLGEVLPGGEAGHCADGIDNDCNGLTDCADAACATDAACQTMACTPGTTRPCYDGPNGTENVGPCKGGVQSCDQQGQWNTTCLGEVVPSGEAGHCTDGIDNDCNGLTDCQDSACATDPACIPMVCTPGATQGCYDGPAGTENVGACRGGTQICQPNGSGWGTCIGEVLPMSEAGHCIDGIDNDCNGLTDCADAACAADYCCQIVMTIYATSATELYTIDPLNWSETAVGSYGVADNMTDIAMTVTGALYTISSTSLYSVNPTNGAATLVMAVPGAQNNALTFLADGTLLGADASGELKVIDPVLGTVTNLGLYGNGYGSSGDLVAIDNGTMYGLSATDVGGVSIATDNLLITVDTTNGAASPVGYLGFGQGFGLAYYNGQVIGFTGTGQILSIDPASGLGTLLSVQNNAFYGGTTSPAMAPAGCP
jgi:hypothetical protein